MVNYPDHHMTPLHDIKRPQRKKGKKELKLGRARQYMTGTFYS